MPIASELTINSSALALDLAQNIFGQGTVVTGATLTGAAGQSGIYSGGNATLGDAAPSDSGIILSTGNVADFTNSSGTTDTNTSAGTSTGHGGAGYADLDAITGQTTQDAVVLNIDFTPTGDFITMQFTFSSEEYLEYVNQGVNDAFGVWVNGNYIPFTPADNDLVSIDTINNTSSSNLYLDNAATADTYNTEMDGTTVTLSIKAPVLSGQPNNIIIALADGGDSAYDSNVLISANSVQTIALAFDDDVEMEQNTQIVLDVLNNDTDATQTGLTITEINGVPIVVGQTVVVPTGESVTLNADGTLTIQNDGDIGSETFTYSLVDGAGNTDVGFITVNTVASAAPNYIVEGAGGDDLIDASYVGDAQGDMIDNNDALDASNNDSIIAGGGNDTVIAGLGDDTIDAGTGNDSVFGNDGNDIVYGGAGEDYLDGDGGDDEIYGGADNDVLVGDDGNDSLYGGTGDDGLYASSGDNTAQGGAGNDSIFMGTGNDTISGGSDDDTLYGGAGNDSIAGDAGTDFLDGGDGNDILTGGAGNDSVIGGIGSDQIILGDGFGVDNIDGSEDADNSEIDVLDASSMTTDVTVDLSGTDPESGTLTSGTNTATFDNIENITLGSGDDSVTGSDGDDTITAGTGADTVNMGAGDDIVDLGAGAPDGDADVVILQDGFGNDIVTNFDGPTGTGPFVGVDTLDVSNLTDANGDPVNTNDVTVSSSGGQTLLTFPNGETLLLTGISPTDAANPLYLNAMGIPLPDGTVSGTSGDDVINGTYTGDPDGDMVDAGDAIIPGHSNNDDFIEAGAGNDTIQSGLGNDTIYAGTGNDVVDGGGNNDEIYGEDGEDSIDGGNGNDFIDGGADNDTLSGGAGFDSLYGGSGNDILNTGTGDDVAYGGTGDDELTSGGGLDALFGDAGNDTITGATNGNMLAYGGTGDDTITGGDLTDQVLGGEGNDTIYGGGGTDYLDGDDGDDVIFGGTGNDTITGGSGNDTLNGDAGADSIAGGSGDDTFVITNSFGNDTIVGGETGETNGDLIDGSALTQDVTVTMTGDEAGTISNGTDTATFSEIEQIVTGSGDDTITGSTGDDSITAGTGADTVNMGAGNDIVDLGAGSPDGDQDVVILQNGFGNDIITSFDAPTGTGPFVGVDTLDVTNLLDTNGDPVNTNDVTVTDVGGNAVLTFPNGDSITLIGVSPTDADNPFYLNAIGIPLPDGTVSGTAGDDVINGTYTGDPDGDMVDAGDAIIPGHSNNDDFIEAGAGNDTIISGSGSDTVYGGTGNDSIYGGSGDDTLFGEDGDDRIDAGNGDDIVYGGAGNDIVFSGAGNDQVYLGDGNDQVILGAGDETAYGGQGFDVFHVSENGGNDTIVGGEGGEGPIGDILDLYTTTSGTTVIATGDEAGTATNGTGTVTFSEIETIHTDDQNDTVYLSASNSGMTVLTFDGDDSVIGTGGNDQIYGMSGNDTLDGGAGNDRIDGGDGDDTIAGGLGNDTLNGNAGDDTIVMADSFGNDTISGGETSETNGDLIDGSALTQDVTVTFTGAEAGTIANSTDTANFGQIENVTTGAGDDTITGSTGTQNVNTGAGDDNVTTTGTGSDTISTGAGNDTITFSEGDSIDGGTGNDTFTFEDLGETTNGTITIVGGTSPDDGDPLTTENDTLTLGDAADLLTLNITATTTNPDGTSSYTGSVTMDDGTILNFSEIENIICFTPGTRIATPMGSRDIASLKVGDMVVTRDHGLQPIRWIQSRTVPAMDRFAPIRIKPGVVTGQERDLLVSPQHRMMFQGYRAELLFGESEVLVAAKHLVDGMHVTQDVGGDVTYIHMMFDEHEVIYAEGAATESFHPGDVGLTAISDPAREELFALFPELRTNVNGYGQTARRCLKRHECDLLVR